MRTGERGRRVRRRFLTGSRRLPTAAIQALTIAFAELWEKWEPANGELLEAFTIITTEASKFVSEVHDRMPVILAPAGYQR